MNYKEWCLQTHGITGFREGKILNSILLPAFPGKQVQVNNTIKEYGGYIIDTTFLRGYVIPVDNYKLLQEKLFVDYDNLSNKSKDLNVWLYYYFKSSGVDPSKPSEYREPPTVHLTFDTQAHLHQFLNNVPMLNPVVSTNALIMVPTLQVSILTISYLHTLYYQKINAEPLDAELTIAINEQITQLHDLKNMIVQRQATTFLDYANILSLDYSNTPTNGVSLTDYQAATAYAISLKIYAEIHRDTLAEGEYLDFIRSSSLLASYNKDGVLEQSLKTDAYFLFNVINRALDPHRFGIHRETPIFGNLPSEVQKQITRAINFNTASQLYGNPRIVTGNGTVYKMKRFLPDELMHSETNEIIFQGGGVRGHSALFRLIKVGMLEDGTRANSQQKPLYFEYYKVVDNLGLGAMGRDSATKTCLGTYITRLTPCTYENNQFTAAFINPVLFPKEYQTAMEDTLRRLIGTERYLSFYFNSECAPAPCPEVHEWAKLYATNQSLSGQPYAGEVDYYSNHPSDPHLFYLRRVVNQRNFYQEGGSCSVFSLKNFVLSSIGPSLGTLHSVFMQLNGALGHIDEIEKKIRLLQQCLVDKASTSITNYKGSFFSRQDVGLQLFKCLALEGAKSIDSMVLKSDSSSALVVINCTQPALLAASIDSLTIGLPKLITDQNKIFIDLARLQLVCGILKISYDVLINTMPKEPENPMNYSA